MPKISNSISSFSRSREDILDLPDGPQRGSNITWMDCGLFSRGPAARLQRGDTPANALLCRVLGRRWIDKPQEHTEHILQPDAWHNPSPRHDQSEEPRQPAKVAGRDPAQGRKGHGEEWKRNDWDSWSRAVLWFDPGKQQSFSYLCQWLFIYLSCLLIFQIPILVVGTKSDLLDEHYRTKRPSNNMSSSIATQCGADEILLNSHDSKSLAPGTNDAVKLSRFLDKVIERKFSAKDASLYGDRRRFTTPFTSPITSPYGSPFYSPYQSPSYNNWWGIYLFLWWYW